MEWYEKIRERREALGLSQSALAREVDISQAAINKIEGGLVAKSRFLPRIAKRLGIPLEELDQDYRHFADSPKYDRVNEVEHRLLDGSYTRDHDGDTDGYYLSANRQKELWFVKSVGFSISRPPFLSKLDNLIAVLADGSEMSPEINSGDILFITDEFDVMVGSTCLFLSKNYKTPSAILCRFAFVVGYSDNAYAVKMWSPGKRNEDTELLSLSDWYTGFRVIAKYYGGWDERRVGHTESDAQRAPTIR